jgi:hypothetical protein
LPNKKFLTLDGKNRQYQHNGRPDKQEKPPGAATFLGDEIIIFTGLNFSERHCSLPINPDILEIPRIADMIFN